MEEAKANELKKAAVREAALRRGSILSARREAMVVRAL